MASISSLGAGSGIDLESLLSQLLAAESQPVETRLNVREARTQATISAFGAFRASMDQFSASFSNLSQASNFTARSVTSSDSALFAATATGDAAVGSYDINVLNLATRQKLISTDFDGPDSVVGTGSLNIAIGIESFNIDITTGTLEDIVTAINDSADNIGVTATIITVDDDLGNGSESRLVLTAENTGEANQIAITVTDDDLGNEDSSGLSQLFFQEGNLNNQLTEQQAATDGQITVDGFTVSSANNIFSSAISGVTVTALAESPDVINDPPSTLTVSTNTSAVRQNISNFVDSYNSLQDTIDDLTQFDADSGASAALNGDFTVRTLQSQTRSTLTSDVSVLGSTLDNLVNLGITTDENGRLSIDNEQLTDALTNQFEEVTSFFSASNGLIRRLDTLYGSYLGAGGILQTRESGLTDEIGEISDERDSLAVRLDAVERRFRNQFAALDTLVASLNAQSDFLIQQLANNNSIVNRNSNEN